MGAKQYRQCPNCFQFLIFVQGKCVFGGRCGAELCVLADGVTWMKDEKDGDGQTVLDTHKCDVWFGRHIWAEFQGLSAESRAEFPVRDGVVCIEDRHIILFANAIRETIASEPKMFAAGGRKGARRVEGAVDFKARLLKLAGLMGIEVETKEHLITQSMRELVSGQDKSFFGLTSSGSRDAMSKSSAIELFGLFNDWMSSLSGSVDSLKNSLCVHATDIASLRDDVENIKSAGNALVERVNAAESCANAAESRITAAESALAEVQARLRAANL